MNSHIIVCSWCAHAHVSIHACDFTNGCFQGQEIDRILLYRIPADCIPEEGISGGAILAFRVPICGAKDAGQGSWLRLKNTCKQLNFSLDQVLPTLFTLRNEESKINAVMSSNVDDLLHRYLPEKAEAMNSVLQQFLVGKEEHSTFRFCGEEFRQDIHVTAQDNTERVQPITYDAKHGLTRKATASEVHQLRSVTQSLVCVARQTRPDLSHRISKIQSTFENVCVRDLRECNRIVEYAVSTSTRGIYFSLAFSWDDAVVVTISDASFCQEQEHLDEITQNFKSQQACVTALAAGALYDERVLVHPLSWSSTRITRVCRRTLMAEAYALSNAFEHGSQTQAAIVDMRGQLNIRREETASAAMGHVWFTDL